MGWTEGQESRGAEVVRKARAHGFARGTWRAERVLNF